MGLTPIGQVVSTRQQEIVVLNIIWIVVIGIIARFISPGPNELGAS